MTNDQSLVEEIKEKAVLRNWPKLTISIAWNLKLIVKLTRIELKITLLGYEFNELNIDQKYYQKIKILSTIYFNIKNIENYFELKSENQIFKQLSKYFAVE